jgi:hypothetical protein
LDREAHGNVGRAVENLKDLVAHQTTEFTPGPLFGNNPAIAGIWGRWRRTSSFWQYAPAVGPIKPVPLSFGLALAPEPNCDHAAERAALGQVIEFEAPSRDGTKEATINEATHMLAEKFILILETVISRTYSDGSPRIVSTSRHVPIKLPSESGK